MDRKECGSYNERVSESVVGFRITHFYSLLKKEAFVYNLMISRKKFLEGKIASLETAIEGCPSGRLEIYKNRKSTKWFVKKADEVREYIPKSDVKRAEALAKRMVMEDEVASYKAELEGICEYLKRVDGRGRGICRAFSDERVLGLACELSQRDEDSMEKAWEWARAPFMANPGYRDKLVHRSPSGHVLRSKSERDIDKALFERGIPFRYECVLRTSGGDEYPDFTFYKPRTGEYRYWEHNGMMEVEEYRRKYKRAMSNYLDMGIYPGINLICTYETKERPLSYEEIERNVAEIEAWLWS